MKKNSTCLFFVFKTIRLICVLFLVVFSCKYSIGAEFYDVDRPTRQKINQNYNFDIDIIENTDRNLDISKIDKVYIERQNALLADKLENDDKKKADVQEKDTKRKKFAQKGDDVSKNPETEISKKENKTSWLKDWLPKIDTKPFEMLGAYTSLTLMFVYPINATISASETSRLSDRTTTLNLFKGTAKYYVMPSFFMAVGNDRFKYWRYEVELGYLPILASNTGDVESVDAVGYTFELDKKDLSFHLLTIACNNYLQYAFFNQRLVAFVGVGIGAAYAWTMGNTLSSDFVLPFFSGKLGISFMVGEKSKVNIAYTIMYSQVKLPNNFSFNRKNPYGIDASNKAIQSGSLDFGHFLINGLSLEYQFYTG